MISHAIYISTCQIKGHGKARFAKSEILLLVASISRPFLSNIERHGARGVLAGVSNRYWMLSAADSGVLETWLDRLIHLRYSTLCEG
jgi:hypothetical protein